MNPIRLARLLLALSWAGLVPAAAAADGIATVKSFRGDVRIERAGSELPVAVGTALQQADTVVTGSDGSAGLTFADDTLISLGARSRFVIDRYRFDRASKGGEFQSTLSRGRMAVVSGKIAKSQIDAMKVRTPTSLLGVRGTEFVVEADR